MITIEVPTSTIIRGGPLAASAMDLILANNGIKRSTNADLTKTIYSNIGVGTDIRAADLQGVIAAGGNVFGLPIFIRMTAVLYNSDVPSYLPDRLYYDENEVEYIRKWSEWKDDSHSHIVGNDGEEVIVPGNSYGQELIGTVVNQLITDNYTVYNLREVREILATDNNFITIGE